MVDSADSGIALGSLAERFGLELIGAGDAGRITGVCALVPGRAHHIAFADGAAQRQMLAQTRAAAVILPPALAEHCPVPVLVAEHPKLTFARVAGLFAAPSPAPGIHATAVVEPGGQIDPTASVGAHAVIAAGTVVAAGVVISAGCVIGAGARIGERSVLGSHTSIGARVRLGARVHIEPNAVIGARGFGLVHNGEGWEAIPQLGSVRIADDVEIGAGTTIDRGALDDTVIETGVKIDDQVHVGHNCIIGAHTVIAGCTGIAGSCTIGSNCMIGGGVGIGDHVRIADGVIITAASQVPKDIESGGVYSSTFRAMPAGDWRRRLALFRQLDRLARRLKRLERADKTSGDS